MTRHGKTLSNRMWDDFGRWYDSPRRAPLDRAQRVPLEQQWEHFWGGHYDAFAAGWQSCWDQIEEKGLLR